MDQLVSARDVGSLWRLLLFSVRETPVSSAVLLSCGGAVALALIDRLGGRTEVDDELGPRDLIRLCGRITARLLIIHGADDDAGAS